MATPTRVGKYEIAEQIGVGGFGVVYKAWDPYIQRWVALKTCSAVEEETTQRFYREAQLAGALQHPNITLIFDFGIEDGTPYFVQELLSGTDLDELLKRGPMSLPATIAILLQVCAGLEYAHARSIIHRDIKPANVRVMEDGSVKIMDFGIAKSIQSPSRLTQTGVALGTAGYLAPEQLSGKPLDIRTDLFSLGVMAYEMVTGTRPFAGPSVSNVIYQILNERPAPLRQRNPACPERLEKAILKALARNPDDRFPSGREFAHQLREVELALGGKGARARLTSTTAVVRAELARHAALAAHDLTAPTQLAVRPLDHVVTEVAPTATLPARRRAWPWAVAAAALAAAAGLGTWWFVASPDTFPLRAMPAAPLPTAIPAPPPPTPVPAPPATPVPLPVSTEIFVDPPAELSVDGRTLGRVQTVTLPLLAGAHTFHHAIPGYREQTVVVTVSASEPRVTLRLPPFGILSVFPDFGVPVRDARVRVDGTDLGALPLRDSKIEAGRRSLVVTWPDGTEYREEFEVPAATTVRRTVRPQ
jgi:eukaryotic-like serine/threonine-protein kinase